MDIDPQEPSGAGEAVKDQAQLLSLEQEETRLIQFANTNVKPGLTDDAYANIESHLAKELGRPMYGVRKEWIDELKTLVRAHDATKLTERIHDLFRELEVGKRHEITTSRRPNLPSKQKGMGHSV